MNHNSATLGLAGDLESIIPLHADHTGLAKFPSSEDDNYKAVFRHVELLIEGAGTRQESS